MNRAALPDGAQAGDLLMVADAAAGCEHGHTDERGVAEIGVPRHLQDNAVATMMNRERLDPRLCASEGSMALAAP